VNPSVEARERHPWRPTVPRTHTAPPSTVGWWPWESRSSFESVCFHYVVYSEDPGLALSEVALGKRRQRVARAVAFLCATGICRGRVCGGLRDRWAPWVRRMCRTGWAGRPTPVLPFVQDCTNAQGAHELTGVRAHCLRGTASHTSERTAASGWAGPRSGTCSVPCQPTHDAPHPGPRSPRLSASAPALDLDLDVAPDVALRS